MPPKKNKAESVFVSHAEAEKAVAIKIKSLLRHTFGRKLGVFVSSDYRSIPSGDSWFDTITMKLKDADVVLVLLSNDSVDRRWINFEAGVGFGARSRTIPIVIRNFAKSSIGRPLELLQARDIHDVEDLTPFSMKSPPKPDYLDFP